MLESEYQSLLKNKIKIMLPGCMVLKTDPGDIKGIPDLIVFYKDRWAVLEVKREKNAKHQPLQDYWVNLMNEMSYGSFIYPENEQEVLDELQRALSLSRETCVPKSESECLA